MLLVNGFKPIQKNYNNQNPNKTNFSQAQFHLQTDSVSFGAKVPKLTKAEQKMNALVQLAFNKHPNLFGANFKRYMAKVNAFMEQNGLSFDTNRIGMDIGLSNAGNKWGMVHDATDIYIRRKSSKGLNHTSYNIPDQNLKPTMGITRNDAIIEIFSSFEHLTEISLDGEHLKDVVASPKELVADAIKIKDALIHLQAQWREVSCQNDSLKIRHLQEAFKTLMPEE